MILAHIPMNYQIENAFDFELYVKSTYPHAIKKRMLSSDIEVDNKFLDEIVEAYKTAPRSAVSLTEAVEQFGIQDKTAFSNYALIHHKSAVSNNTPDSMIFFDKTKVGEIAKEYLSQNATTELIAAEENEIAEIARKMPITSGHNFEGYRIVRYAGYVSGDEVATIPMGFFTGTMTNDSVNNTIKRVRNVAIKELKEAAANIGCNAVIGLDFDYITIDRSGANGTIEVKIVLTANGTAVEIEPL